jgi:hypothetical protein
LVYDLLIPENLRKNEYRGNDLYQVGRSKIPMQTQEILRAVPDGLFQKYRERLKITEGSILLKGKTGYCKGWWEIAGDSSNLIFGEEGHAPRK